MFTKKEVAHLKMLLAAASKPAVKQAPKKKKRNRKSRAKASLPSTDAPVSFTRTEAFAPLDVAAGRTDAYINYSFVEAPLLKTFTKFKGIYECYRLRNVSIHYVTSVSALVSGQLLFGYEMGKSQITPTKSTMQSVVHSATTVSKSSVKLKVAVDSSVRYTDKTDENRDAPFTVLAFYSMMPKQDTATNIGDIYITYTIDFFSLKP